MIHPLAAWLLATKTTQAELAEESGAKQSHISAFLHGAAGFSGPSADRLVAATERIAKTKGLLSVARPTLSDMVVNTPPRDTAADADKPPKPKSPRKHHPHKRPAA